jgi:hypothetical protein
MTQAIGCRISGIILLIVAMAALYYLRTAVQLRTPDIVPGYRFELALLAVLSGFSGSALLVSGPRLFDDYEWPPRQ